jgi:hypothetical protein
VIDYILLLGALFAAGVVVYNLAAVAARDGICIFVPCTPEPGFDYDVEPRIPLWAHRAAILASAGFAVALAVVRSRRRRVVPPSPDATT